MEYYSALKGMKILTDPAPTKMSLEDDMLGDISRPQKDKHAGT